MVAAVKRRFLPVFVVLCVAALAIVAASGCSGDDGGPEGGQPDAALQPLIDGGATYYGRITVTVRAFSICAPGTAPRLDGEETTEQDAVLIIGPPQVGDDGAESNVLNLVIAPAHQAEANDPGALFVVSAEAVETPAVTRLLQFWELELDGTEISGRLTEPHADTPAAYNQLAGEVAFFPCQPERGIAERTWLLARGATLEGTIDPRAAVIDITAVSDDGLRTVRARIEAELPGVIGVRRGK
jgi:hypothetical protein